MHKTHLIGSSHNNTWTMRMETEVKILGNLAKFLSNVCEQRESYCEAAFDRKLFSVGKLFSAVAYGPGSFSWRFREISWPLFVSCLRNIRERQNDFGLESNLWDM